MAHKLRREAPSRGKRGDGQVGASVETRQERHGRSNQWSEEVEKERSA
jgi:hypothetical protein